MYTIIKVDGISIIFKCVCAAHNATMLKVRMTNTRNYLVVVGGEETWFLSSYHRSQHSHQRQSSDVCVNAVVSTLQ